MRPAPGDRSRGFFVGDRGNKHGFRRLGPLSMGCTETGLKTRPSAADFVKGQLAMQSDAIKKGIARAPARAMLKATGLTDADLARPLVAIANTWTEVTPCNLHLRQLAEHVKAGIRAAGGTPIEFDTITISDGITMGTEGMKGSLVSREVIADSIELFVGSNMFD